MRPTLLFAAVVSLSACVVIDTPAPSPTPSGGDHSEPGAETRTPAPIERRSAGRQIAQCGTSGAREAVISYPSGWDARVSRAETEDELLGGAQSVDTDGRVEPVNGVSFAYPPAALSNRIEAVCAVKFNLSRRGVPSQVLSACSDPLFVEEARRAVSAARFKPVRINGDLARGINVVHRMTFCLGD